MGKEMCITHKSDGTYIIIISVIIIIVIIIIIIIIIITIIIHVARMEEGRSALGRSRRRWEDNIRMDLEEIGINAGNWVDSAQDRNYWRSLVNAALNLRVP